MQDGVMTGDFIICLLAFLNIYIFIFFLFIGREESFCIRKESNMAAVSLFWDTNMAAVTSLFSGEL